MMSILRTHSDSKDFIALTLRLDAELSERYGKKQSEYDHYNKIEPDTPVVIAYSEDMPIGCGCFKKYNNDTVEIKRMYVALENRGAGVSTQILAELEKWAMEMGFSQAILETGVNSTEAIGLYTKKGYSRIANYGQYVGMGNSICFGKDMVDK